jgi:hypothetical protein
MKPTLIIRSILFILFLSIGTNAAFALTYTTLAAGSYNNITTVWSTNGVTPCGCAPPTTISNHTININHNILLTSNLAVANGGILNIAPSVTLSGTTRNIATLINGVININGTLNISQLTIGSGTTVNLVNGTLTQANQLQVSGTFNIDNGDFNLNGGNLSIISPGGSINTSNSSVLYVWGGNISNADYVFICNTCCLTTVGSWSNTATGVVAGSGSAQTTGGNISNSGSWDANLTWCTNGTDFGMTSPENCGTSNFTCGTTPLPVELESFSGGTQADMNKIEWVTSAEINNSHFIIEKSIDALKYEEMTRVEGAGNSNMAIHYSINDELPYETTYYRLKQVDLNGTITYYGPISVTNTNSNAQLVRNLFPNPAGPSFFVDLYSNIKTELTIIVDDSYGRNMFTDLVEINGLNSYQVESTNWSSGIYTVKIVNGTSGITETRRVVIQ